MSLRFGEPAVARKVGEGYDKPNADQELPIDINYKTLTDWLVSRQKLPADWHKRVQVIQAKAVEALKEVPASVLTQLFGGTDVPIDYFRAVRIRDKLAETAERKLFGGYSGAAGAWDSIVRAYEKNGVFVGEAAQTLVQHVDYEIPYLRRQATKLHGAITEAERKQADYVKQAAACSAAYKKECSKLSITGASVRSELGQLVRDLPYLFKQVVEQLKGGDMAAAVEYYRQFVAYAHASKQQAAAAGSASAGDNGVVPTLREVRDGRTEAPADDIAEDAPSSQAGHAEIDWDIGAATSTSAAAATTGKAPEDGGINWDFDLPAAGAPGEGPSISWDVAAEAADSSGEQPAMEVDWNINVADAGAGGDGGGSAAIEINWDIDVSAAGAEAAESQQQAGGDASSLTGAAAGKRSAASAALGPDERAALRLERDADYRALLLDDLQELRAFLLVRRGDMASSTGFAFVAAAPQAVRDVDASSVRSMLAAVDAALEHLRSQRLQQLLLIAGSRSYLDRLVAGLQRRGGQEARMLAASRESEARRNESKGQLVGLAPKVAQMVERMREIKGHVERTVGAQLGGRRVNVLGDINTVLASTST